MNIQERFPMASLAKRPTPIRPLSSISSNLFVKQDDLSGSVYGGNKIRKLEFLMGEALREKRKTVMTYGAAGSNHALATAICAQQLGLQAVSILAPQEPSAHVCKNLLAGQAAGAELVYCPHFSDFPEMTRQRVEYYSQLDGVAPYIIPTGGTNAVGALGFVQAGIELAQQIPPDVVYVPMGTGGTLSGLLVGLKLAGLKTKIEAVRVVDPAFRDATHIRILFNEICQKLEVDLELYEADFTIRDEFFGDGYGIPTSTGMAAIALFEEREGIFLENTYTAKTVAALLHDLDVGALKNKTVLYWNTLNSRDLSSFSAGTSPEDLPDAFRTYFN